MPTKYIEPISEISLAQPGTLRGVTLYLFILDASRERLGELLGRTFSAPSGGRVCCRPAGNQVILACTSIDWLASAQPERGHIRYDDIAFWIPTLVQQGAQPRRLAMFPATIIVNQPHTMVTGRETFGLTKEMGWFEMPASPEAVESIRTDVWGLRRPGIDQRVCRRRLFEIRRVHGESPKAGEAWRRQLMRLGLDVLPWVAAGVRRAPGLACGGEVIGLRQLRDPSDPSLAAHQSIITAPIEFDRIHGGGALPGRYHFDLVDLVSHPLAAQLGLEPGGQQVSAAGWLRADLSMGAGRTLWTHGELRRPQGKRKRKIAILGGGMGGVTTALALSNSMPRDELEITIYQRGWRLGGKGASGRNAAASQRIEEHGLHVWYGFYDNAFRLMREVYGALDRDSDHPLASFEDAFHPQRYVVANERRPGLEGGEDGWTRWRMVFEDNGLSPGEGPLLPEFWRLADQTLGWVSTLFDDLVTRGIMEATGSGSSGEARGARLWSQVRRVLASPRAHVPGALALRAAHALTSRVVEGRAGSLSNAEFHAALSQLLERARTWIWRRVAGQLDNDEVRKFWCLFDTGVSIYLGLLRDDLATRGLSAIDHLDLREWLRSHGAKPSPTLDHSPLLRFIYNAGFAFEQGDHERPNFAAGAALRALLRILFTYKGALLYEMNGGMGDVVFAPIYALLRRRGVRIAFFHDVRHLGLSADGRTVERIELVEQAELRSGDYEPLVSIGGVECWPSEPRYEQLRAGEALRRSLAEDGRNLEQLSTPSGWTGRELTLARGVDFDEVVLALPVGAQRGPCRELREHDPRWAKMFERTATVATQAYQFWFGPDLAGLGWTEPSPIFGTYVDPVDTWADMSHLIEHEGWTPGEVGSLAYLCGVMPDIEEPEEADIGAGLVAAQRGRYAAAQAYLEDHGAGIWPALRSADAGAELRWELLHDPQARSGPARMQAQYCRANVEGSDRYVQSLAGTIEHRLAPDESGFDNLVLAGDWTKNGLDCGCIEATVMSGLQAARALGVEVGEIVGETDTWLGDILAGASAGQARLTTRRAAGAFTIAERPRVSG